MAGKYDSKSELPNKDDYWLDANYVSDYADTYTKNRRVEEGYNSDQIDNRYDAIRHMGGTMGLMQEYPDALATAAVRAREGFARGRDDKMDVHNNRVGEALFNQLTDEQKETMTMADFMSLAEQHLNMAEQAKLAGESVPEELDPIFYYKEGTKATHPLYKESENFAEGGLAGSGWDEDPMMPSEAGLESGEEFTPEDAALFAAEMAPVSGEILSAKYAVDDFQEGDYLGAALNAVGAIPGVGVVGRAAKKGGKIAVEAADEVYQLAEGMIKAAAKEGVPNKTVKAYKLFRTKEGSDELFPLFVNADKGIQKGEWIPAEVGSLTDAGKVKSSIGPLAYRPGWHAGDNAAATHIGGKSTPGQKKPDYRPANQVWAEVEMADDVDWQSVANSNASIVKSGPNKGKLNAKEAQITDQVPTGGHYRYKTNPNMQGEWLIGGEMKINDVMDNEAVKRVGQETGVPDLPSLPELIDEKGLQFSDLTKEAQSELKKYYPETFSKMTGDAPEFNEGGLMKEDNIDPVSGNEIPPGSTAENVRDDIPAMLSEGEFVLPADVVKWHGLKEIMEWRCEAKEGLMAMEAMDQIKSPEIEAGEGSEHEAMETPEEETLEDIAEGEDMDENGNGEYPTEPTEKGEMGPMSSMEFGDEELLVLMAADGGAVTDTPAPKQRVAKRLVRDPKTGKMIVIFIDIATGKQVGTQAAMDAIDAGTATLHEQSPQNAFKQVQEGAGQETEDKSTAEEVVDARTSVAMPSAGGNYESSSSEPVERTLGNNYGFIDPSKRGMITGLASLFPGGGVLSSWGINANNTDAVNAARAELGLDPVDTTLGVNMDAAMGMVTDQTNPADDVNIGPFSADVMMTDQIGRTARVADPKNMSTMDKIKDSKAARFFTGKNVTLDDVPDVYTTSSYLTPFEIQEKQAAGLTQRPDGSWGYSAAAEQIGRETFADMSKDEFGSDLGLSTADKYGLSLASDRGRQEALGIAAQDAELFDENDDGKLDAAEQRAMKEFYAGTSDSGSQGLGYDSSYGSQAEADAVASSGWGSKDHFDAIEASFNDLPSSGGGNYDSGSSDTNTSGGSDFSLGSWGSSDDSSIFNKGGMVMKPKRKYATIKKK